MKNYYTILGVAADADVETIKVAYRKLSKKFHPDVNGGDPFFAKHFQDIHDAYETLSITDQRATYDAKLSALTSERVEPRVPAEQHVVQPDATFEAKIEAYHRANQLFRQQQAQYATVVPSAVEVQEASTRKYLNYLMFALAIAVCGFCLLFVYLDPQLTHALLGALTDSLTLGVSAGAALIALVWFFIPKK